MRVVGAMSGSSLDGLDLAQVKFEFTPEKEVIWDLQNFETVPLPDPIRNMLLDPESLGSEEITDLDLEFGRFVGNEIKQWIGKAEVDLISSHGHTVFHQPDKQLTLQIGSGRLIHQLTGIPTVCDFRKGDVLLGGQGAPLVPVGERDLFKGYDAYINLGGIVNVSIFDKGELRSAFDIAPFNQVANHFAEKLGSTMDENGSMAERGEIIETQLENWNRLSFYAQKPPRSLGREWVISNFLDKNTEFQVEDLLATFYEHVKLQVEAVLAGGNGNKKVMLSGGGAKNSYFVKRLETIPGLKLHIPDPEIVDFKEAIVFAYLGLLRVRGEKNIFAAATGASRDSIGGDLFGKISSNE